jgi:UDP-GlcNAc:undecaprenyl-phosphate/decaprenyl-phosphate GlcNAc-1-phosphate transferase
MNAKGAEACIAAFVAAIATTPLVIGLCSRFALFDQPGPLKIHTRLVPRLGGLAIAIAMSAGMLAGGASVQTHALVLAAFAVVWLTGLLDDLRTLSPLARLAAQLVSAFLVWRGGFGLPLNSAALSMLGTALIVILGVNSLNFWDGSDGLAAGFAAIAAIAFFSALHRSDRPAIALACSTAAGCIGFLAFNLPPAKIFMGDSGSTLLGFCLAFLTCDFYRSNRMTLSVATFPVFVCALPLLDAGLAIIRRLRNARAPVLGDRSHFYDLLLARGWSGRAVALTSFATTWILAVLGWLCWWTGQAVLAAVGVLVILALLLTAVRLGALRRPKLQVSSLSVVCERVETRPAGRE